MNMLEELTAKHFSGLNAQYNQWRGAYRVREDSATTRVAFAIHEYGFLQLLLHHQSTFMSASAGRINECCDPVHSWDHARLYRIADGLNEVGCTALADLVDYYIDHKPGALVEKSRALSVIGEKYGFGHRPAVHSTETDSWDTAGPAVQHNILRKHLIRELDNLIANHKPVFDVQMLDRDVEELMLMRLGAGSW